MAKTKAAKPEPAKDKSPGLMPRLNIPVSADRSRIAYDSLQERTRDQLRTVLADPELRARLELAPDAAMPAAAAADDGFPPDFIEGLYDALSKVTTVLAQRWGYTAAQSEVMAFDADDKSKLVPPTNLVLDKYLPGGLTRWGPEVMLGLTLATIVSGKITLLRNSAAGPRSVAAPFPQGSKPA